MERYSKDRKEGTVARAREPRKETENITRKKNGRFTGNGGGGDAEERLVNDGARGRARWDIVDYEIGSGYGPLNDAERTYRRDDGVCNGAAAGCSLRRIKGSPIL